MSSTWEKGLSAMVRCCSPYNKTESAHHLNYWERLKELRLYSLQRRERYLVMYVWKILGEPCTKCGHTT
ncbi:hypothetical protein E2C01_005968 [Portunus trituberculatus]|uniref:Uncharacterized protein n=1 Tax=Portunus trituberculatus TaxID=210409 RepID=A0A5B7CWV7_PORTR|nr:hypothetical protein [Portunus trituberculatus]